MPKCEKVRIFNPFFDQLPKLCTYFFISYSSSVSSKLSIEPIKMPKTPWGSKDNFWPETLFISLRISKILYLVNKHSIDVLLYDIIPNSVGLCELWFESNYFVFNEDSLRYQICAKSQYCKVAITVFKWYLILLKILSLMAYKRSVLIVKTVIST